MHILVIERDPDGPKSLARRLQDAEFQVTAPGDPAAGLQVLRRRAFAAVVCDPLLPMEDGAPLFVRLMRRHPLVVPETIFVMSGTAGPSVRRRLADLGQPVVPDPGDTDRIAAAIREAADRAAHRRVLLIEDDPANRTALTNVMRQAGLEVHAVEDAIAGYAELERQRYGVIVCDVRMPYLSGKSFFEQLEQSYPNMAGRVVFVTAWANEPDTKEFLTLTGQPFFAKPYDLGEFTEAVVTMARRPL